MPEVFAWWGAAVTCIGLGVTALRILLLLCRSEFGEFACGCDTVAHLGVFDAVEHDIVEEVDDGPAVVGHLAYDFGEGWWLIFGFGFGFGGEHVFYCNAGRRMGSTGCWRGGGWG